MGDIQPISGTNNFTLNLWFSVATYLNQQEFLFLLAKRESIDTTTLDWQVAVDTIQKDIFNNASPTINTNQWYMLSVVGINTNINVYLNGAQIGTNWFTRRYFNGSDTGAGLHVGAPITSSIDSWFNGNISDLRIYNRALSSNEISNLYALESIQDEDAYLSQYLPTNSVFFSALAANTNFVAALASSITASSNNYGISQVGPQGPQGQTGATGPQGPVGPQGQKGVFDPTVLTNTAFLTGLASNSVFLNALSAQIHNGSNNFGLAVKQNQTLTFPAIATVTYATNAPKITLSATSSSGLTNITYTSANGSVATILNNSMTIKGAGSTTITASQVGNALWNPVSASQTFVVNPITQTLSFPKIPTQLSVAGQHVTLGATSSAKLNPITYSVANTAIALVSSNVLTILGSGSTTVTATNVGTQNYTPAGAVQTLIVK